MNFRKAKKAAKRELRIVKWMGNTDPRHIVYVDSLNYLLKGTKDTKKKKRWKEIIANSQKGSRKRRRLEKIKESHDNGIPLSVHMENLKRDGLYSGQ